MKYIINKKFIPITTMIDLVGGILFFWKKLRKKPIKLKKVLFIRLEHIGDMVMATPVFELFKKCHPQTKIHVLCRELTVPIIKNNPYIDKIIIYEAPWFIRRKSKSRTNFFKLLTILRKESYDLIFEMHGDPRNNLLAFMTGAYSIGYGCRGGGFFLNKLKNYDNKKRHNIIQNLILVEDYCQNKILKSIREIKTKIFTDEKSKKNAEKIMKKYNLKKNRFIIINPLSGRKEKNLTKSETEYFIEKNKNFLIVLTGSKEEREFCKSFENRTKKIINLCGKTDLLTLTELVKYAKKVIAPDTGIIHIARAVETNFEAVYKTTNKNVWGYE
ncbi:MAG: glycosyltransferase family 9 protein [Candidatus Woesearchaeota archaeon]